MNFLLILFHLDAHSLPPPLSFPIKMLWINFMPYKYCLPSWVWNICCHGTHWHLELSLHFFFLQIHIDGLGWGGNDWSLIICTGRQAFGVYSSSALINEYCQFIFSLTCPLGNRCSLFRVYCIFIWNSLIKNVEIVFLPIQFIYFFLSPTECCQLEWF